MPTLNSVNNGAWFYENSDYDFKLQITALHPDATLQQMQSHLPPLVPDSKQEKLPSSSSLPSQRTIGHMQIQYGFTVSPNTHTLCKGTICLPAFPSSFFVDGSSKLCRLLLFSTLVWNSNGVTGRMCDALLHPTVCVCVWAFVHVLYVCIWMCSWLLLKCSYICLTHNLPRSITQLLSAVHQSQGRKSDHGVLEWDVCMFQSYRF